MNSFTPKKDASLDKELQKRLSKEQRKNGVINQGKYSQISNKRKIRDREYHVQDNADIAHKDVKMYCDTNQFPTLPFCGTNLKPRGARGLGKHYHLRFDPN